MKTYKVTFRSDSDYNHSFELIGTGSEVSKIANLQPGAYYGKLFNAGGVLRALYCVISSVHLINNESAFDLTIFCNELQFFRVSTRVSIMEEVQIGEKDDKTNV